LSIFADILFALKPRCPVCKKGRLFKRMSLATVDECAVCGAKLSLQDVGDGAAVFMIFLLGLSIVPMALAFEHFFAPPMWLHMLVWGSVALSAIAFILPMIKAYVILLQYRHRPGEWDRK
jgi:uncharacterized protein (DUF983 family)